MRYRDRSFLVAVYRNHKARQAWQARQAALPPEPPPITVPERVAVVVTIRGYWRGCHPERGHRWHRDISKAARYRSVAHAERDAAHTFLAREVSYRVELIPYDYTC